MTDTIESSPRPARSPLLLLLGVAAVVLLGVALFSGSGSPDAASPPAGDDADSGSNGVDPSRAPAADAQPDPDLADLSVESAEEARAALRELERLDEGDPFALGPVDAPVVMILWSDFQCPFCAVFARDTKPVLVDRFVDDGTLRIEWRDYPMLGDGSVTAAVAGRAAAQQGAFWAMHDAIYEEDRPRGALDVELVTELAGDLGLDVEQFAADLDDEALLRGVAADHALAGQLGISGTPSFLVNGYPVVGAQPLDYFVEMIASLAEAG